MKTEPECRIRRLLSEFTTYRIGGSAEKLYIPKNTAELAEIFSNTVRSGEEYHIIGGGSNLLISDRGLSGTVILMTECCTHLKADGLKIRCGASVELSELVRFTVRRGIAGLERLMGIPGTVGGALKMNAGAFGSEISRYLISVSYMDSGGKTRKMSAEEVSFSYRAAPGLESKLIIGADFEFERFNPVGSARIAAEILRLRRAKQPLEYPSAGSVFKEHHSGPAGKFIDEAGLKGLRIGRAEVSTKHANFIINLGGARAIEVLALIRRVQRVVQDKFGIELELEQKILGFTPEELQNPEKFL